MSRNVDAAEKRLIKQLPQSTQNAVADVKRVFGKGARVIAHLGPRPSVCGSCRELKDTYTKTILLIRTKYDSRGGLMERKVSEHVVSAMPWRRRGKIVKRRWPHGRVDWMCSFCGKEASET
jgi:hypothetical protein